MRLPHLGLRTLADVGGGGGKKNYIPAAIEANAVRIWSTRRILKAYAFGNAIKYSDAGATNILAFQADGNINIPESDQQYVSWLYEQNSTASGEIKNDTLDYCPAILNGVNSPNGMIFDGSDDTIAAAPSTAINNIFIAGITDGATGCSVSCWMKPTKKSGTNYAIKYGSTAGSGTFYVGIQAASGHVIVYKSDTASFVEDSKDYTSTPVWNNIVVTFQRVGATTTYILYVNGESKKTSTLAGAPTSTNIPFNLGNGNYAGGINDVIIYNKLLSSYEVLAAYTLQRTYYGV